MTGSRTVLLVDDNPADNFYHRYILEQTDLFREILEFLSPFEALDFFRSAEHPPIDLLLLDINMPGMNGFEFLEEFEQLDPKLIDGLTVIILSNSLNPEDKLRAERSALVKGFHNKPLNKELLRSLPITESA